MTEVPGQVQTNRLALLLAYLGEDAGRGDLTTESLGIESRCTAEIVSGNDCTVAGTYAIHPLLKYLKIEFSIKVNDGERTGPDSVVMELTGNGASILNIERLILNIIGRMSGIATATRELVDKVRGVNPQCRVAATRKTTPGFRIFEKEAVIIGGGHPHRFDLSDAVMIKDNHLKFVTDPGEAVKRADDHTKLFNDRTQLRFGSDEPRNKKRWIEVEADNIETAEKAVTAGADIVMLDNMTPEEVKTAYTKLKAIRENVLVEVSGGITPKNIMDYAKHADMISLGWLTHSAPSANFSMNIVNVI